MTESIRPQEGQDRTDQRAPEIPTVSKEDLLQAISDEQSRSNKLALLSSALNSNETRTIELLLSDQNFAAGHPRVHSMLEVYFRGPIVGNYVQRVHTALKLGLLSESR